MLISQGDFNCTCCRNVSTFLNSMKEKREIFFFFLLFFFLFEEYWCIKQQTSSREWNRITFSCTWSSDVTGYKRGGTFWKKRFRLQSESRVYPMSLSTKISDEHYSVRDNISFIFARQLGYANNRVESFLLWGKLRN